MVLSLLAADRYSPHASATGPQEIPGAPPGTDLFAGLPWGEIEGGVQLRLAPAWAATARAARDKLFPLALQIRNVSEAPVPYDPMRLNYELEYEVDGRWYAFPRPAPEVSPVPTSPAAGGRSAGTGSTIPPGREMQGFLVLVLGTPSPHLALVEVGANASLTVRAATVR